MRSNVVRIITSIKPRRRKYQTSDAKEHEDDGEEEEEAEEAE